MAGTHRIDSADTHWCTDSSTVTHDAASLTGMMVHVHLSLALRRSILQAIRLLCTIDTRRAGGGTAGGAPRARRPYRTARGGCT